MPADSPPTDPVIAVMADVFDHDTHQRVVEDILAAARNGRLILPAALRLIIEARYRCEECGA